MVQQAGYKVDIAENGLKAIDAHHKKKYDAILMDIHMPLCNGFEATQAIRQLEEQSNMHTPIIAVTAAVSDERSCIKAGMDGM